MANDVTSFIDPTDPTDSPEEARLRRSVGRLLPETITWRAWPAVLIREYNEALDSIQEQFSCSRDEAVYLLRKVSTLDIRGVL